MCALGFGVRMSLLALFVAGCAGAPVSSTPPTTESPVSTATRPAATLAPSPTLTPTARADGPPSVLIGVDLPESLEEVPSLECPAGMSGADIDYAPDADGGSPDLEIATRALRGVRWTDVIGLEEGRSAVVRDGRAVFLGSWFRSGSGRWLLASFEACDGAGIGITSPRGLEPDAMVEVLVDGLDVVDAPSTAAERVWADSTVSRGDDVFIVDGPVEADGRVWYLVSAVHGGLATGPFGWVAATGPDGSQRIDDISEERCPVLPEDARQLGVTADELLLHCLGGTEVEFSLESGVSCSPWEAPPVEPAWFSVDCGSLSGDACGSCAIPLAVDPEHGALPAEQEHAFWAFRGHFDDPAAAACRLADASGAAAIDVAQVVHRCRTTFVLTSLIRLGPGTD